MNDIFSKAEKEPRQGIDILPTLAIFQNLILRGLAYSNLLKIQEMKLNRCENVSDFGISA